ncbi:hypothetical protein CA13_36050 [Planctomycetes bacterium CA13]|uniref:Uncharacterized protein n=1 Tax=Novipirellula herctigrandis TaxID=2527986 RepID=A0A5C5Z4C8_9BACT|nr:hypothetical protein CA13_36050 [Planctomycetes bacterium CA13]
MILMRLLTKSTLGQVKDSSVSHSIDYERLTLSLGKLVVHVAINFCFSNEGLCGPTFANPVRKKHWRCRDTSYYVDWPVWLQLEEWMVT